MYFEEIVWNIQQQGEKKGSSLLLQRGENISEVASSEPNLRNYYFRHRSIGIIFNRGHLLVALNVL